MKDETATAEQAALFYSVDEAKRLDSGEFSVGVRLTDSSVHSGEFARVVHSEQCVAEERADVVRHALASMLEANHAYVVISATGYWGRGKTLADAAGKCFAMGAGKRDKVCVRLVLSDPVPTVDSYGALHWKGCIGSMVRIGDGLQLGALMGK